MTDKNIIHATCVEIDGKGVLFCGKSGSGKSDLALRLIDRGHNLVSDDQVVLRALGQHILASPPDALEGMLEVHGVGICQFDFKTNVPLMLVVDLKVGCSPERMPDFSEQRKALLSVELPWMMLDPFHATACLKVIEALKVLAR